MDKNKAFPNNFLTPIWDNPVSEWLHLTFLQCTMCLKSRKNNWHYSCFDLIKLSK